MTFAPKTPIAEILTALDTGQTTAAALLDTALDRAKDASGEGSRVFTALMEDSARAEATASDGLRQAGVPARPLEGLPISVKDLFDVKGAVTTAGSRVLASEPPAEADAPVVARLRAAGAVIVGRTNMTEFAYSRASASIRITAPQRIRGTGRPSASPAARPPGRRSA